jgi:hypothetical protein
MRRHGSSGAARGWRRLARARLWWLVESAANWALGGYVPPASP